MIPVAQPTTGLAAFNAVASKATPLAGSTVVATQPNQFYPTGSLALLTLKCPALRNYCNTGVSTTNASLASGLATILSRFQDNEERSRTASVIPVENGQGGGSAEAPMEEASTSTEYLCAQARADDSTLCPARGCVLPDGTTATLPTDLLTWGCNVRKVGHTTLARSVLSSEFSDHLALNGSRILVYREGVYEDIDDKQLVRKIFPHLGTQATLKEAMDIAKVARIQGTGEFNIVEPSVNHIAFSNGTYNILTSQLEPHHPSHMLRNRIPHPYIGDAACEGFIDFLRQVWRGDPDQEDKIRFIRQWIGYLFVADASQQKMLVLWGEGANGKSVLMHLIEAILGSANITSAMLDRLKMPYVRATMEGKLLNQSADLPKIGQVADGDMKAMVSGDPIEVSPKYEPSYTIKPYVRFMVATNNLPNTKDESDGYFRRLIVLPFNRQFAERERDPGLLDRLIAEIPGIIAWAVEGLHDLREHGRFTIPASSGQAVSSYRDEVSPLRMFADECLARSTDRSGFASKDIFLAYRGWCKDHGFAAGNVVTFGRAMASLGFEQRKSGTTIWMATAKAGSEEYFRPACMTAAPANTDAAIPASA